MEHDGKKKRGERRKKSEREETRDARVGPRFFRGVFFFLFYKTCVLILPRQGEATLPGTLIRLTRVRRKQLDRNVIRVRV